MTTTIGRWRLASSQILTPGDLIPRSGGLRKIRLGVAGRGKRGGARVVYYWVTARSQIYMLLAYAKNVQEDLTERSVANHARPREAGVRLMERKLFEELAKSVKQAGAIARGKRKPSRKYAYSPSRVQAVRESAELSQAQFARLLNVSVRTLQNWEQARREPTGPAKALLRIVEQEPAAALRALGRSDAA